MNRLMYKQLYQVFKELFKELFISIKHYYKNKQKTHKIIFKNQKYTWSKFDNVLHFYIIDKDDNRTVYLCEDHYHDNNGNIIDVIINDDIIKYAISKKYTLTKIQNFYVIDTDNLEYIFRNKLRKEKFKRLNV